MTTTSYYNTSILDGAFRAGSWYSKNMRNWIASEGSSDTDLLPQLSTLRARSRDSYRNNPLAKAIVDRYALYTIGSGLKLQVSINHKALGYDDEFSASLERSIEERFEAWSKICDFDRTLSFGLLCNLAFNSALQCGDSFVHTPAYGTMLVQILEADQVASPNFYDDVYHRGGIELDKTNYRPSAYWLLEQHPGEVMPQWKWSRVPMFGDQTQERRLFQLMLKSRPGEHRGVPILANVLDRLKVLDKYTEAELTAAFMASCMMVAVETETGLGLPHEENSTTGQKEIPFFPGMVFFTKSGEKINLLNPARPNAAYAPFVHSIYEQIGAGVSLPMEFILQLYGSSYSASRAAIDHVWKVIKFFRELVIFQMCDPIFHLWLKWEEIDERIIQNIKTSWVGPERGSLDEYREALAATERINNGTSTREKECQSNGNDYWDLHKKQVIEERRRREEGLPSLIVTPPVQEFLKDDNNEPVKQPSTQ